MSFETLVFNLFFSANLQLNITALTHNSQHSVTTLASLHKSAAI